MRMGNQKQNEENRLDRTDLVIDDRENILLVFLRFENQGQDNGQEYKEGTKAETNIIWTEEISQDGHIHHQKPDSCKFNHVITKFCSRLTRCLQRYLKGLCKCSFFGLAFSLYCRFHFLSTAFLLEQMSNLGRFIFP